MPPTQPTLDDKSTESSARAIMIPRCDLPRSQVCTRRQSPFVIMSLSSLSRSVPRGNEQTDMSE
ncbi:hypothetical protein E2C01_098567 [Portunus trituberculatus]|uniref:Uncharacterized protein n=1 Tax=Portunus trituberculatus TaxID=210409 RepID=A0A5B7KD90_PORTR|nr:hypothetical protein [Portunus trituberculatus]